jgi:hypothetical protein
VQQAQLATAAEVYGESAGISVFPTITHDQLFVNFDQPYSNASLQLYSVMGQLLSTTKLNASRNILHLLSLTPGMYLYHVIANGKVLSGKLVKQ